MSFLSRILNGIGDMIHKPSEASLVNSQYQFKEQKKRLLSASLDLRKKFDLEYVEFERSLRRRVTRDQLHPKDYKKIVRLVQDS